MVMDVKMAMETARTANGDNGGDSEGAVCACVCTMQVSVKQPSERQCLQSEVEMCVTRTDDSDFRAGGWKDGWKERGRNVRFRSHLPVCRRCRSACLLRWPSIFFSCPHSRPTSHPSSLSQHQPLRYDRVFFFLCSSSNSSSCCCCRSCRCCWRVGNFVAAAWTTAEVAQTD